MKLAYIVSLYPAVSHTFVMREVLALRAMGYEITTISMRATPAGQLLTEADRAEFAGTHVVTAFKPLRLLAAVLSPMLFTPGRFLRAMKVAWKLRRPGMKGTLWAFFYFLEALIVHRIARQNGIEHLHAHFANVASDVAMIAASLGKRPVGGAAVGNASTFSFTMHGPTEFFDVAHHRLGEKARAARFVLCISDFARSQLMPLIPPEQWSKLQILHCGVDPEQFRTARNTKHETRNTKQETINILCVARLSAVKGHAILLKVVEELALRGHEVHLNLIGDGPLRKSLEELAETMSISNRVTFHGSVGQDVIATHYAAADVFVLPSFAEGVPVVLMEAMAAKCPVVATRINGIPELIEDGVTGLLVPPGRPDLLANAVERIVAGPRQAERMALAAHEKIKRDYNLHSIAPQLNAIFQQMLKGRPRASVAATVAAERELVEGRAE
jgi:glycosyltransferase involved in cell wall biosynthesis